MNANDGVFVNGVCHLDANAAQNTGYLHKYANVTFVTAQHGVKTHLCLKI